MKFTKKQQQAIDSNSKSVLVSAAAGSGKTSVLSHRIARLVLDGYSIENMLVMTFTNAAAAEMRQRIAREISLAAAGETGEKAQTLRRQATAAQTADISTFHSFCGKLIRQNFAMLGVSPAFRILSDGQSQLLRFAALRELFDTLYEQDGKNADFLRLLARFCSRGKDEQLSADISNIYNYMMSRPTPDSWLAPRQKGEKYIALLKSRCTDFVCRRLVLAAKYMEKSADCFANFHEKQCENDAQSAALLRELAELTEADGIGALAARLGSAKIVQNMCRGIDEAVSSSAKIYRDEAKKIIKQLQEEYFLMDFKEAATADLSHTQPDADAIAKLTQQFRRIYDTKKAAENALDYNDMEHFALKALENESLLHDVHQRYTHIFVDEYQDTNPVQEVIISKLHEGNHLFLVGDMKQSIYKFRLADPTIFLNKSKAYQQGDGAELILMNDNFRSTKRVIDAVNGVMERLMSHTLGEVEYDEGERLLGEKTDALSDVRIFLTEVKRPSKDDGEDEETEKTDKYQAQAILIADSIQSQAGSEFVLSKDPSLPPRAARWDDFAVLVRSRCGLVPALKEELDRRGIPCLISLESVRNFPEQELFINLLRLVLNQNQDVPLLSVMRSYLGNFDENDFAQIRLHGLENFTQRRFSFYACAKSLQAQNGDLSLRLTTFFEWLDSLSLAMSAMALPDFVNRLAQQTEFLTYLSASDGGEYKATAFSQFLELCGSLCETYGNSLFALLDALENIKKTTGAYVKTGAAASEGGCVKICTIHGSKGLEFPVVFVGAADRRFELKDSKRNFYTHEEFGILPKFSDEETLILRETPERIVAKEQMLSEYLSEELRILYVAMTRASQRLYFTGNVASREKAFAMWNALSSMQDFSAAGSMLDWLMASGADLPYEFVENTQPHQSSAVSLAQLADAVADVKKAELLSLEPPSNVPAKLSVSAIKRAQMDYKPEFRAVLPDDDEISGARLGTLEHSLMEQLVLSGKTPKETADEMLLKDLITREEHAALLKNLHLAEGFLAQPIYRRMQHAKHILREQPFNLEISARDAGLDEDGDLLVQGVLDAAFLEDDGWVLVDYKTDRVSAATLAQKTEDYRVQLTLYARALAEATGIAVKEKYLYFMRLDECVGVE